MPSAMPTPFLTSSVDSSAAALLGLVVVRLDHVEEVLERVDLLLLAPREGVAGLGEVLVAELERVHAELAGHLVDDALTGEEGLRRAPGAERGAPAVVGAHQVTHAAHARDVVAGAAEQAALGEVVAELHVRAVVVPPLVLHGEELAVLVRGQLAVVVVRRALAGVGDAHPVVVLEVHRAAGRDGRRAEQAFHGRAELVAEGAARVVLDHAQLVFLHPEALGDHQGVQVERDALGVDGDAAFFVGVREAAVGLEEEMRLALQVVLALDDVGRRLEDLLGVLALDERLVVVDVGRARIDLDRVVGDGVHRVHVGRQLLELHLDLVDRRQRLLVRVGADDRQRVAVLVHLGVAEDRALPAVGQRVLGEHDEAVDAVLALDVLVRDDLEHARHLLRLADVDGEDVGVGDLGVDDGALQRAGRHLVLVVGAVVDGAGDLGDGRRPREPRVPDVAVVRHLVRELFLVGISPRSTLAASRTASTSGL